MRDLILEAASRLIRSQRILGLNKTEAFRRLSLVWKVQRKLALAVKQELDRVQAEAEQNQKELAELRRRWADEQPEREALEIPTVK